MSKLTDQQMKEHAAKLWGLCVGGSEMMFGAYMSRFRGQSRSDVLAYTVAHGKYIEHALLTKLNQIEQIVDDATRATGWVEQQRTAAVESLDKIRALFNTGGEK